jgi:arylsulfatase A-like enzyme
MNRRTFMQALGAGAMSSLASPLCGAAKRPNIILIMADDMGFSDLGCYGSEIATPNLDRLAARGIRFTHMSNNARCCPTRASLLTGLYPHQTGIGHMTTDQNQPGYRGDLNRECVTIAEALRPAGYRTLMSGKWHVTLNDEAHKTDKHNWPLQRGFDRYFGTIIGAGSYFDPIMLTRDNEPIRAEAKGFYYTDAITDNALKFIDESAGKDQPFFLYTAYTSPHWPLHALPEDIRKYEDRYKGGWDALRQERHRRMIEMGIVDKRWPLTPRDPRVPAWAAEPNKEWQARRMAVYAAQIDRMDQGIGRILRALDERKVADNTLVLFLADNGGCAEEILPSWKQDFIPSLTRDGRRPVQRGNDPKVMPGPEETYQSYGIPWANASNTPFRLYKHWIHEGGISTPLIARWPNGIKQPGSITHQAGHIIDIMATCVDVAGTSYPASYGGQKIKPLEGQSLAPILRGEERKPYTNFWEHEGNRAVRQGKWKLVSRFPDTWELYDLEADRTEMNNLAGANPSLVKELSSLWDAWARRSNVRPWEEMQKTAG